MIKLQLFLSHNGICSRREAMRIIQDGQVRVNGKIEREPSRQVDPEKDRVIADGKTVWAGKIKYQYVMLNKPEGYVTSTIGQFGDKTVLELLPPKLRHLKPVGRLDKNTEGLLLLTNDGKWAQKLTHPRHVLNKVYQVRIRGTLSDLHRRQLERGITLEGKKTAPAKIHRITRDREFTHLEFIIHEGRKRQIRMMFRALGYHVSFLKRLQQGPYHLGDLDVGQWRTLKYAEAQKIR